jgi:hypothetical protein
MMKLKSELTYPDVFQLFPLPQPRPLVEDLKEWKPKPKSKPKRTQIETFSDFFKNKLVTMKTNLTFRFLRRPLSN